MVGKKDGFEVVVVDRGVVVRKVDGVVVLSRSSSVSL
jgi:hypothetical protein